MQKYDKTYVYTLEPLSDCSQSSFSSYSTVNLVEIPKFS